MSQRPYIIGIGGTFSGWKVLEQILVQHPLIANEFASLGYFDTYRWHTKSLSWYKEGLPAVPRTTIYQGEVTLTYLYHPVAAERIARTFPDAKVLAIIQHPLQRAAAEFAYYKKVPHHTTYASCHEFMVAHPEVVYRGMYGKALARYVKMFSPLQLQIVTYDELVAKPEHVAERLYRWLDVDPTFVPHNNQIFSHLYSASPIHFAHKNTSSKPPKKGWVVLPSKQDTIGDQFTSAQYKFWQKRYHSDQYFLEDISGISPQW
jgi:hypothetical protein